MAKVYYDHVTKRFGDVVAVNDMTLEIADCEFLVFVGPSGCGKTTSLRLAAGLEEPNTGQIFIDDRLVNDVPPHDRDTAIVFQNYALYPHMTASENMAFGLKMRGVPKDQISRRVHEAAEALGITYLLDRKPHGMSGGERQRVALGRALVRNPKVFLLDEPLSNLDAQLRTHMRTELVKLHRQLEATFIYVTHDQVEAMTMATRIVVMHRGVIYQAGSPQEVYSFPQNLFVAGFIGSPSMNFVPVTLKESDEGLLLENGSFCVPVKRERGEVMRSYLGQEVVFGVRPEDIYVPPYVPEDIDAVSVKAKVDVVELVGNEILLYLTVGDLPIVARVDPRLSLTADDKLEIVLDRSNCHCFDRKTEQAIY